MVIEQMGLHSSGQALWKCVCDCGKTRVVKSHDLVSSRVTSCGCLASELRRASARKEPGRAAKTMAYQEYKKGAKRRNLDFLITKEEFLYITSKDCYYCGSSPSRVKEPIGGNGNYIFNGIDRKDNGKGYFMDNIVPCCSVCNRAKMASSHDDFMNWIKKVYNHAFG